MRAKDSPKIKVRPNAINSRLQTYFSTRNIEGMQPSRGTDKHAKRYGRTRAPVEVKCGDRAMPLGPFGRSLGNRS